MSTNALNWAFGMQGIKSSQKFVLVALADNAGNEGIAWPSLKEMESKTCLNRKTILKVLDELEECGVLIDTGERKGITKQVKVYKLNLDVNSPKSGTITKIDNSSNFGIVKESQKRNSSKSGTVPNLDDKEYQIWTERVPNLDGKSTKFGTRNHQGTIIEPPLNHQYCAREKKFSGYSPDWLTAEGVEKEIADAFVAVRKAKKAPMTKLAVDALKREAHKAGITLSEAVQFAAESGYQSFKACYLSGQNGTRSTQRPESFTEFFARRKRENERIIDITDDCPALLG